MGREAKAQKRVTAPKTTPVKLDELEYFKLQNLILKADATLAAAQAQVNQAIAARDAYVQELAKKYDGIPKTFSQMQWNDDTCEFGFT